MRGRNLAAQSLRPTDAEMDKNTPDRKCSGFFIVISAKMWYKWIREITAAYSRKKEKKDRHEKNGCFL